MDMIGKKTLRDMWDELALTYADKIALIFEDSDGQTCSYSYKFLNSRINQAANLFLSRGVSKGDRVAVHMNNHPAIIFCWFGLAKIGAIMVPVNTQYIYDECEYLITKCGIAHVVAHQDYLHIYEKMSHDGIKIKQLLTIGCGQIDGESDFSTLLASQPEELTHIVDINVDDPAEILFTSGTTARPKGVVYTHYNLRFTGYFNAWQVALRSDDRHLAMMPAFHADFQSTAAMPAFTVGATIIMLERYSARKFWNQVCIYRATITECIPLMIRTLMLQPVQPWEREHCLRDVYFYMSLSDCEKDAFLERFNVRLLTTYGMTETTVGLIGDRPGEARRWPSIGRVGFGYEAKITDSNGNELPPGVVGDLYVRGEPGKTIFKEYYKDPEATARVLSPTGWLRTDDSAYVDEDGYFYFVDRNVNMIKRSGENISSSEIESVLEKHPRIEEAAVIGVPDDIRDELVKAFVVPRAGAKLTKEEVLSYCQENMAKFKVPSFVEICAVLPRTSTGKVQKKSLRAPELTQALEPTVDDFDKEV